MENPRWSLAALAPLLLLLLSMSMSLPPRAAAYLQERKNYIVHLRPRDGGGGSVEEWHRSFLPQAAGPDSAADGDGGPRIIYSYSDVFPGFAARLTDEEADALRATDGCVRLYPEVFLPLATTRSPGFLGLHLGNEGFWSRSGFGRGVVIGILDTGILPSHPSFGDDGMQPPPKGWKGACEFKAVARAGCNNKIIGARAFGSAAVNSTAPPVDDAGHGTHTASTAAGNFVENANIRGNADGTASGMAPHAHLAIYKVCTRSRCSIMDIIAGLDAAVRDGVGRALLLHRRLLGHAVQLRPHRHRGLQGHGARHLRQLRRGQRRPGPRHRRQRRAVDAHRRGGHHGPRDPDQRQARGRPGVPRRVPVPAGEQLRRGPAPARVPGRRRLRRQPRLQRAARHRGDRQGGALREQGPQRPHRGRPDRGGVRRGGHDRDEQGGGGVHHLRRRARPPGVARQLRRRHQDHLLPQLHGGQRDGEHPLQGDGHRLVPVADRHLLLVPRAQQGQPGHPEAGHHGARHEHPGGVGAERLAHRVLRRRRRPLLLRRVRDVHVDAAPERHRRAPQEPAPGLVPRGDQVGDHDDVRRGGPHGPAHQGRAVPPRHLLRHGRGLRQPGPGLRPRPRLRPPRRRLHPLPLRAGARGRRRHGDRAPPRHLRQRQGITEAELNYPSLVVSLLSQPITVTRTVTNVGKARSVYTAVVDMPKDVSVIVRPPMLRFTELNEKQSFTVTLRWAGEPNVAGAEGSLKWVSDDDYIVRSPLVIPGKAE
ncbi:hypothetical protein PVAP13_9KG364383 [Panicum virgatum]|uniref:Uncharacterized protein n=1 Tax=Panicum virgatum TaxID=38727 RepID=A0A8T0NNB0_PANVG|nr:hypothetical protein PVAP13_9KG364383 [Panicum virgatum]KAG2550957.1 hypothetical protein PVAP13_9KG364383 [Panicum virgatum]KAG2550958.1 hypothetical protein PVAP13_9KG364383 [Panicum virgatum]